MREILIPCVLAAIPGLYSWVSGRSLADRIDDPVLPERLAARQQRVAWLAVAALLVVPLLADAWWPSAVVLALTFAGGFPLRRRLREETWSLPAYLLWLVRLNLAFIGFWILAAIAPDLVLDHGGSGSAVAYVLLAALLLWQAFQWRIALALLRAGPLDDRDLAAAFEQVRARSKAPQVDVWVAGDDGARFVQALALPDPRRHKVLIWPELLRILDHGEATAIYAHEVAHLEEWGVRKTASGQGQQLGVAVLGCLVVPSLGAAVGNGSLVTLVWPLAVAMLVFGSAASRRKHESDSDRRAVELCGDPEALASGLEKVTTAMRMPRRWRAAQRATATHPDLAERLRAIRGQGSEAEAAPFEPAVVPSAHGTSAVVVGPTQIHWLEGVTADDLSSAAAQPQSVASSVITLPVGEFVEHELAARGQAPPERRARHISGRRWSMSVAEHDVVRLQRALEQLPHPAHARGMDWTAVFLASIAGAFVVKAGDGVTASALVAAVAVLHWRRATLMAAAAALFANAAVVHLVGGQGESTLLFLLSGACMTVAAFRERNRVEGPLERRALVVVAAAAAAALAVVWHSIWSVAHGSSLPLFVIHEALLAAPAAVVLPVTIGVALSFVRQRWTRASSMAALVLAGVSLSLAFDRSIRADFSSALEAELPPLERVAMEPVLEREVELDGRVGRVRLWPDADGFAVDLVPARDGRRARGLDRRMRTFRVERGGVTSEVRAIDVALLADDRMLVVRSADGQQEVALLAGSAREVIWRAPLPNRRIAHFFADHRGQWQLTGAACTPASAIVTSGTIAGPQTMTKNWGGNLDFEEQTPACAVATSATAVSLQEHVEYPAYGSFAAVVLGKGFEAVRTDVSALDGESRTLRSRGYFECVPIDVSSGTFVCKTLRDGRTRFWLYEPRTGEVVGVGALAGEGWPLRRTTESRFVATRARGDTMLIDAKDRRAYTLDLGLPCAVWLTSIDVADNRLAASTSGDGKSLVRLYTWKPEETPKPGA